MSTQAPYAQWEAIVTDFMAKHGITVEIQYADCAGIPGCRDYAVALFGGCDQYTTEYMSGKAPAAHQAIAGLIHDAATLVESGRDRTTLSKSLGYGDMKQCMAEFHALLELATFFNRFISDAEIIDLSDAIREAGH